MGTRASGDPVSADSLGGSISIEGDDVVVRRSGLRGAGREKEQRWPIASVSGVRSVAPNALKNGHLQFLVGGAEPPLLKTTQVASDEQTVMFRGKDAAAFRVLQEFLEDLSSRNRAAGNFELAAVEMTSTTPVETSTPIDQPASEEDDSSDGIIAGDEDAVQSTVSMVQLASQTAHATGMVGLAPDGGELVIRSTAKSLLTRKERVKEERIPLQRATRLLVQSRDRLSFDFDIIDQRGRSIARVTGIARKSTLDTLVGEVARRSPETQIEMAHPSYGLPDPVHEQAQQARDRAERFNKEERKLRDAAARPPQRQVKTYDNGKEIERDARSMAKGGWSPEGQVSGRGGVSAAGTAGKLILTGGLGAVTGFSRKGNRITVTWVKPPPEHTPRDFQRVPVVPPPRTFEPEPYATAMLLAPVSPGAEYPPTDAELSDAFEPPPELPSPSPLESPELPILSPLEPLSGSITEELERLAVLRDSGMLTDEEFAAAKARILGT